MRSFFLILFLAFHGATSQAQAPGQGTISGFVYDAGTGEALVSASVLIMGTTKGTTTNSSGFFSLAGLPEEQVTLYVRFLGYKAAKVPVTVRSGVPNRVTIRLDLEGIVMQEVLVTADSIDAGRKLFEKPVSNLELSGLEIKQLPAVVESDLMRSLQTLPGIVSASDFSSQVYVRGGTPDQNLYMIDGADVYNPEHAFGLFSTFNTDAIKTVTLSKGGFGAQYGGRLSSVLDITHLDGNRSKLTGTTTISLLAAKTTLQTPLGNWGSMSGSFRRTYFDVTLAKLKSLKNKVPDYYFYDGNLKLFAEINETNKLTVSWFSGRDFLDISFNPESQSSDGVNYEWGNKTASVKWLTLFNSSIFANFWVTASRFDSDFRLKQIKVAETNEMNDLTLKGNLEWAVNANWNLLFGFENKWMKPRYTHEFQDGLIDIDRDRVHQSVYSQASWKPADEWVVEGGLRLDRFAAEQDFVDVSPRYSVKYQFDAVQSVKLAGGVYRQYLHRIPRFFIGDIWITSDSNIKPSTSVHTVFAYERALDYGFTFQAETFYKTYTNLNSFKKFVVTDIQGDGRTENGKTWYRNTRNLFDTGDGNTRGIELFLKKDGGMVTGWLAYSWSSTDWKFKNINRYEPFNPRHDRSHTVNLVLNTEPGKWWAPLWGRQYEAGNSKWLLGFNLVYSTGQPITTPGSAYLSGDLPDSGDDGLSDGGGNIGFSLYPGEINAYRLPAYIRADLSLTWERKYERFTLAPYIQIYNLGGRQNIWFVNYEDDSKSPDTIKPKYTAVNMFPFLPTVGLTITF